MFFKLPLLFYLLKWFSALGHSLGGSRLPCEKSCRSEAALPRASPPRKAAQREAGDEDDTPRQPPAGLPAQLGGHKWGEGLQVTSSAAVWPHQHGRRLPETTQVGLLSSMTMREKEQCIFVWSRKKWLWFPLNKCYLLQMICIFKDLAPTLYNNHCLQVDNYFTSMSLLN